MATVRIPLPSPAAVLAAALLGAVAPGVAAQQAPATPDEDPGMVVARTVQPRIAYRGLPASENPVHTRATLFPLHSFLQVIDGTTGTPLADEALGERGSAGLQAGAVVGSALMLGLGPQGLGATGAGASAGGPGRAGAAVGAGVGGAIRTGTAGLGRVLAPVLGATPSGQGGGR